MTLSDGELLARLIQRGVDPGVADQVIAVRADPRAVDRLAEEVDGLADVVADLGPDAFGWFDQ